MLPLDAVLGAPHADAPREAYADACEDSGDLARARFIRLQLRQARLGRYSAQRFDVAHEIRLLEAQHRRRWLSELPHVPGVTYGRFRRGFVDSVFVREPVNLADALPRLVAAIPLARWVSADGAPSTLALPSHAAIEECEIAGGRDGARAAALGALLAGAGAQGLRKLAMSWPREDERERVLDKLVGWGCALEELELLGRGPDHHEVVKLSEAAGLSGLQVLRLDTDPRSGGWDGPEGRSAVEAILDRTSRLRSISLPGASGEAAQALFDHGPATLEQLGVGSLVGVRPESASFTLKSIDCGTTNGLSAPCFSGLRRAQVMGTATSLELPPTLVELAVGAGPATCSAPPPELEALTLVRCPGLLPLVRASSATLRVLKLLECGALPTPPSLPRLHALRLYRVSDWQRFPASAPALRSVSIDAAGMSDDVLTELGGRPLSDVHLRALPAPFPAAWALLSLTVTGEDVVLMDVLPASLPLLQDLSLCWTGDDSAAVAAWLERGAPNLTDFYMSGVPASVELLEMMSTSKWSARLHFGLVTSAPSSRSLTGVRAGELSETSPLDSDWS